MTDPYVQYEKKWKITALQCLLFWSQVKMGQSVPLFGLLFWGVNYDNVVVTP